MNRCAGCRVVLATFGSEGDVRPFLSIGSELRHRGHAVTVATHGVHEALVISAGLDFLDTSAVAVPDDARAFVARAFHPLRGPRFVIRDLAAVDAAHGYRQLAAVRDRIDLLVTSTLAFGAQILAEQYALPWVSVVLAPAGFVSAFDPPVTGIAWLDRLARRSTHGGRRLRALLEWGSRGWTAPVRRLRRDIGLAAQPPSGDPLYRGQHAPGCVLALFPPSFAAPQPDWPPQTRQTGFAFHPATSPALSVELAAFLDAGPAPLVYTLGSAAVHAGERFLHESLEASRALGMRAVLLTGSPAMRASLPETLPAGVLATPVAPHAALFPRAAAVIHHGGIGTSAEALLAARPMLVVPHGFDQPDNAAHLSRLGVAEVLPARRYRAARVVPILRGLLDEPRYRRRAQDCADMLQRKHGATAAADAIEVVLRS